MSSPEESRRQLDLSKLPSETTIDIDSIMISEQLRRVDRQQLVIMKKMFVFLYERQCYSADRKMTINVIRDFNEEKNRTLKLVSKQKAEAIVAEVQEFLIEFMQLQGSGVQLLQRVETEVILSLFTTLVSVSCGVS